MLEMLLCSLFTVLPDYLYRRYAQDKRIGREITFYSVWYELRYGITTCVMLTVALITVIFYYHPSTTSVTSVYRTVPILPEASGRVADVFVGVTGEVQRGAPLFKIDSSKQQAALDLAMRRIDEVNASAVQVKAELAAAEGQVQEAKSSYEQAVDELETKQELQRRSPGVVAGREIERLQKIVEGRDGTVRAAIANRESVETKISTLIPAERATAEAARDQAQVDIDKTTVYAGFTGRVEQFVLRRGDVVNPLMRPAGILIPSESGRSVMLAGFGQIEAQVIRAGMIAEVTCLSKPWTIVPMVVTAVQDYIASGQFRASDQLVDFQQTAGPGTIAVFMEPLFDGGLNGVTPGSSCIANAYTSNHALLASNDISSARWLFLHAVDAVALVHAMILRLQALVLPVKILVFSGH